MKKYYSDYVGHCARLYFNSDTMPSPVNNKVSYNNYIAVSNALDKYEKDQALVIRFVYTADSLPKAVNEICINRGLKTEAVWYMIQAFERDVALERGLI